MSNPVVPITGAPPAPAAPRPSPLLGKARPVISGWRDDVGQALASELRAPGAAGRIPVSGAAPRARCTKPAR